MDEAGAVMRPHELARVLEVEGAAEEAGRRLRLVLPAGAAVALLPPVLGLSPGARVAERIAESADPAAASDRRRGVVSSPGAASSHRQPGLGGALRARAVATRA